MNNSSPDLGGAILRDVSRSFYLSIRFLPSPIREPVGLAYLLARTSDTIADSADTPVAARLRLLAAYYLMLNGGSRGEIAAIQNEIQTPHAGEQRLLTALPRILDWLDSVNDFDSAEIIRTLGIIIGGQTGDLELFGNAEPGRIIALPDAAALEQYAYAVAGSVGEFWTRICLQHLPAYSKVSGDELLVLGRDFGKALQVVNILRDLPEDLANGRCYLPADEIAATGLTPGELFRQSGRAMPVYRRWHQRGCDLFDAGRRYTEVTRGPRLRFSTFLPWRLGVETMSRIADGTPLKTRQKIKVGRTAVYRAMIEGACKSLLG